MRRRGFWREPTVESLKISTVFFSSVRYLAGGEFNSLILRRAYRPS